jgi:hypothetical protein
MQQYLYCFLKEIRKHNIRLLLSESKNNKTGIIGIIRIVSATRILEYCKLLVQNASWWWTIINLKHVEDNLSEKNYLEKVCILLVFLTYV